MEFVYSIPNGERVYAIGDLHGCSTALEAMHSLIDKDLQENPVERGCEIYVGDYIDRGPDSRGVVDRLIDRQLRKDGIRRHFLRGNHEHAMMRFIEEPRTGNWLAYGGLQTLKSYGLDTGNPEILLPAEIEQMASNLDKVLPKAHRQFVNKTETSISIGGYFFCHAGVRPNVLLSQQNDADLLEIREPFLSCEDFHEKRIVYGHTAYDEPFVRPNRIGIDTRCVFGGKLTCAVIEGEDVRFFFTSEGGEVYGGK